MKRLLRFIIPFSGLVFAIILLKSLSVAAQSENIPAISNANWIYRADLPIPDRMLGGDTINGEIYVVGGWIDSGPTDALFSYDPISDTWHALTSLPTQEAYASTIAEGGKLYVAGGCILGTCYDYLYAYTPGINAWESLAEMPENRGGGGIAAWQGKLYYVGGSDENGIYDTVYEYDIISDTWTLLTTLPEARANVGAAIVDGVLFVIGGYTPSASASSDVWGYDLNLGIWTVKTSMLVAKLDLNQATKSYNGKVYVVGGYNNGMLKDVEVYDPVTDTWQMLPDLPRERAGVAVALVNGDLHAIGGFSDSYGNMADHTVLQVLTIIKTYLPLTIK